MTIPDLTNASLGGGVGVVFDGVIATLKFLSNCPGECKALEEQLKIIQPTVEEISNLAERDGKMDEWLNAIKESLERAEEIGKECNTETTGKLDRVKVRVNTVRYGNEILKLRDRIKELVANGSLLLSAANLFKAKSASCWMEQEVPKKILGRTNHLSRLKSSITEAHKSEGGCVGIRGMGGSGKTLLAKMVNNDQEMQELFGQGCIFWITVGRDASVPSIYAQMRRYLGLGTIDDGISLEDQRTHLMNAFSRKGKTLLILDDVWDTVHKHHNMIWWLNIAKGPGRVSVVTTRMESTTRECNCGVEVILELSEEQSWVLFCTHAFGACPPPSDKLFLEEVAREVCKECKCLPLALEVVGLAMKSKCDISEWRRTLRHLRGSEMANEGVDEKLFKRLKISYDDLRACTKICFLYFAAFPEDCAIPEEHLYQMWVAEALFGEELGKQEALDEARCALNELRGRSLIEDCSLKREYLGSTKGVKMHDILRDLAISTTRDGGKCGQENVFEVGERNLEAFPKNWVGSELKVRRMSLWANRVKRFPENFIAPCLKICALHPTPWDFYAYGVADGNESIIEEGFFQQLKDLRFLQLCGNRGLKCIPGTIGELGLLQHLNLSLCSRLSQLPKRIGELGSLQHLNLSGCWALTQLPERIGELGSLEHFDLSWCRALTQLPERIGELGSLQHFNLSGCRALTQLPKRIGELRSLQHLNLFECEALKQLPERIGELGSLQHLDLSKCKALTQLPDRIGELGSLQYLDLSWCSALTQLPERIGELGSLQHLNLYRCESLTQLPERIGELGSLQHLNLSGCKALTQLPERIGELGSLQHLDISWCIRLTQLPERIGELGSLQHLDLFTCLALTQLPERIGELGSLRFLNLRNCPSSEKLPELRKVQELKIVF